MARFPDLDDCSRGASSVPVLSVGWLDAGVDFERALPSEAMLDRLWRFCLVHVAPSRGIHRCPFCESPLANVTERDGVQVLLGSAEIRVFGKNGSPVFAAPNLVFHYVAAHHYLPPVAFIEALATGPQPGTPEYERLLESGQLEWIAAPLLGEEPTAFKAVKRGDEVVWEEITRNS